MRLGLFRAEGAQVTAIAEDTIEHDESVMARFGTIAEQLPFGARRDAGTGSGEGERDLALFARTGGRAVADVADRPVLFRRL